MTITGFTPLADSTVEARARRGRKGAKAELARRSADGKQCYQPRFWSIDKQ